MDKDSRFVGLDVHAETIAVGVAEPGGEVRSLGTIPNTPEAVRRLVKKLGPPETLRVCYEAGPTGYVLYRQLTALGVPCAVIAPTLVPVKAGDRVKTDRRDAEKLARSYRSGDLTPVWVPDPGHEALRDLVRAREAAKKDQLRARHRLGKFLLRQGRRAPTGSKAWGVKHRAWLQTIRFAHAAQDATLLDYRTEIDHAADRIARLERAIATAADLTPAPVRAVIAGLQALRGIAKLSAVSVVTEVGALSRFAKPRQLMGYSGAVASEHSSGPHRRRGGIIQDRERPLAPDRDRSRLGLSASPGDRRHVAHPAGGAERGSQSARLESAASSPRPLRAPPRQGESPHAGRHGDRPRAPRIYLAIGVHIERHTAGGAPAAA